MSGATALFGAGLMLCGLALAVPAGLAARPLRTLGGGLLIAGLLFAGWNLPLAELLARSTALLMLAVSLVVLFGAGERQHLAKLAALGGCMALLGGMAWLRGY